MATTTRNARKVIDTSSAVAKTGMPVKTVGKPATKKELANLKSSFTGGKVDLNGVKALVVSGLITAEQFTEVTSQEYTSEPEPATPVASIGHNNPPTEKPDVVELRHNIESYVPTAKDNETATHAMLEVIDALRENIAASESDLSTRMTATIADWLAFNVVGLKDSKGTIKLVKDGFETTIRNKILESIPKDERDHTALSQKLVYDIKRAVLRMCGKLKPGYAVLPPGRKMLTSNDDMFYEVPQNIEAGFTVKEAPCIPANVLFANLPVTQGAKVTRWVKNDDISPRYASNEIINIMYPSVFDNDGEFIYDQEPLATKKSGMMIGWRNSQDRIQYKRQQEAAKKAAADAKKKAAKDAADAKAKANNIAEPPNPNNTANGQTELRGPDGQPKSRDTGGVVDAGEMDNMKKLLAQTAKRMRDLEDVVSGKNAEIATAFQFAITNKREPLSQKMQIAARVSFPVWLERLALDNKEHLPSKADMETLEKIRLWFATRTSVVDEKLVWLDPLTDQPMKAPSNKATEQEQPQV